jgi:hypothetical protein
MGTFDIVGLTPLLGRTRGRPEMTVALIDGPVHGELLICPEFFGF